MAAARALHQPVCSLTPTPPARWRSYCGIRRITCPAGHLFPQAFRIPESGFLECRKHTGDSRQSGHECHRWVYLLAIRGGGCLVIEVQPDELRTLEALSTPHEVLEYLGIFPA